MNDYSLAMVGMFLSEELRRLEKTRRTRTASVVFSYANLVYIQNIYTHKSPGLGQAKPEPSRERRLWPGLRFSKAKAASSQAKAGAFRPSRAVHSPKHWRETHKLDARSPILISGSNPLKH
jgi:hypothetical protein